METRLSLFRMEREPVVRWWVGNEWMDVTTVSPLLLPVSFSAVEAATPTSAAAACVIVRG